MNAQRFSVGLHFVGLLSLALLLLPVWVQANPPAFPERPRLAIGPCEFQCFEGAVEYNPETLTVTRIERFDKTQNAWVDVSATTNPPKNEGAKKALSQVIQNMTLPGFCPDECECRIPTEKPPFSPWSVITVSTDYIVKSGGKSVDYRAYGTVEYRSRVVQGQCDLCSPAASKS
ncbi:MAG TPA: hypothetical protein V6C99_06965 [Oculatellaceae cyanobacterium]